MKIVSVLLASAILSGCGTLTTLSNTDNIVTGKLRKNKTYCGTVPRIYSGLIYDYCTLFSDRTANNIRAVAVSHRQP